MEYEKIKQLMDDMENSKLTSLELNFPDGMKISMKKEEAVRVIDNPVKQNSVEIVSAKEVQAVTIDGKVEEQNLLENKKVIKAPMVGTFYLKPSPTSDPYVQVGETIQKGDIVCIIEAMKLMNEIEADVAGKVVEVLVKDGEPVEYGMPLFVIE